MYPSLLILQTKHQEPPVAAQLARGPHRKQLLVLGGRHTQAATGMRGRLSHLPQPHQPQLTKPSPPREKATPSPCTSPTGHEVLVSDSGSRVVFPATANIILK